ncbi:MAG: hypothetical protein P8Y18_04185 [Candidatus Bathyarchaeota archaeon]
MWKYIDVPEKVIERKIIVYKPRVNIQTIRSIAENMKTQIFRKFIFVKPKPEEVHIVSIDKYFEPYVFVDGEYRIIYSKKWVHNVKVDETMQELTIYGEKVAPKSLKKHLKVPCKILQLKGCGRFKFEIKSNIIFDKNWQEVGVEELPFLPFEEQPERILSNFDRNYGNIRMTDEKEVEILKSRIIKRPSDILTIHHELFEVDERAEIYKPMYKVVIKNFKSQKELILVIDAITGKTKTVHPTNLDSQLEENKKSEKSSPMPKKDSFVSYPKLSSNTKFNPISDK